MKAKRVKRKSNLKKVITTSIFLMIIFSIVVYLYDTYQKIDISSSNYETQRVQSTKIEETVENREEKSKNVADILEETMESIVGISKLKDNGNSIFLNSDETSLRFGNRCNRY